MKTIFVMSAALLLANAAGAQSAEPKVKVTDDHIEVLEPIAFDSGKADVLASSNGVLDELAAVVKKEHERVQGIRIEGHTDNTGDAVFNAKLSDARAHAVEQALISRGVPGDWLVARGFGPKRPIADNATPEGRAKNRRVELLILSKEQLMAAKDASIAHLTSKVGVVEIMKDGVFGPIEVGAPIMAGATLRLVGDASADLSLKDDTRLHLKDGATLTLNEPKDKERYNAVANLKVGSMWVTLSELSLGKVFSMESSAAVADFDLGEKLAVMKGNVASLSNLSGRPLWVWRAGRTGKPTQVKTGQGVSVTEGGAPKMASLPQAPVLGKLPGAALALPGRPFLTWPKVAGAETLHVWFAGGVDGLGRLTEVTLPGDALSLDGGAVPSGWQWVSVQAKNKAGFSGPLSAQRKVHIVAIESDARPKAGPRDVLSAGTLLKVPAPAQCRLGGGDWAHDILLSEAGPNSVQCRAPGAEVPAWNIEVAKLELVPVAHTDHSPFKESTRHDFALSSTAPLPRGVQFVVDGAAVQYHGIRRLPGDDTKAWASFVPLQGKKPVKARIVRQKKTLVVAPVSN